jgi:hypothetical protein
VARPVGSPRWTRWSPISRCSARWRTSPIRAKSSCGSRGARASLGATGQRPQAPPDARQSLSASRVRVYPRAVKGTLRRRVKWAVLIVCLGRVSLTTRRLRLVWRGGAALAEALVARAEALGYRLMPFDPAGLAAGNVMLMSLATWLGLAQGNMRTSGGRPSGCSTTTDRPGSHHRFGRGPAAPRAMAGARTRSRPPRPGPRAPAARSPR